MTCELLKGCRMLDLTDEKGALCGKMFADLGAEVIKVEPPQGCSTRAIPPFLDDRAGPDSGLYFLAYQAGKKSITLNLENDRGRALLGQLAAKADFLVESFPVGYLDKLGVGYQTLSASNPRLIHTSITPFGDQGPGKDYKAADLITWASGGMMFLMGEEGRPPLQMALPQAGLHAGAEAAVASLIAHYPREIEGLGQHVVVNMQACIVWTLMNEQAMPILHGDSLQRTGMFVGSIGVRRKMVYQCRDGYISTLVAGGSVGGGSTKALVEWMGEKGFAAEWMVKKDWSNWTPGLLMRATDRDREEIVDIEDRITRFLMTMDKAEIYEESLKRRILFAPVSTVADIASDRQLKAREFFRPVPHEVLGRTLTMPGPFARLSATPLSEPSRTPRLGEHNAAIYGELGINAAQLTELKRLGAI